MWTRAELKSKAKSFLRTFYWQSFLVTLIVTILVSGLAGGAPNQSGTKFWVFPNVVHKVMTPTSHNQVNSNVIQTPTDQTIASQSFSTDEGLSGFISTLMPRGLIPLFQFIGIASIFAVLLSFAIIFLVLEPLSVGSAKFFIQGAREEQVLFNHLGHAFRREHYWNVVLALAYRALLSFLFFLLLIIPGIIKAYAYSMVPYILADNPTLSPSEALKLSVSMTEGHKWEMFVLDLSFILWNLLDFITFGLAKYFVQPYKVATWAQLYLTLKPMTPNYKLTLDFDTPL